MEDPRFLSCALPARIHLAWCGPDVVVLDIEADEYALLIDAAGVVRPGETAGAIVVRSDLQGDLEALGLILTGAAADDRPAPPARTGEIALTGVGRPDWGLAAAALNSIVSSADFQGKSFAELVATARGRRQAGRGHDAGRAARATAAFQAVHPFIPFEGDCLQRAYRLHHHLRRTGISARWVFGVRTWPFLAHCWVQVGDRIVGDSLDRVAGFTPILAV